MADRVRAAPARKRAGARRPARRKRKRRPGLFVLAFLAALILGFLAKRVMIPSAVHYIAYRAPDQPQPPAASDSGGSEQLTPADRSQLDAIIKHKSR